MEMEKALEFVGMVIVEEENGFLKTYQRRHSAATSQRGAVWDCFYAAVNNRSEPYDNVDTCGVSPSIPYIRKGETFQKDSITIHARLNESDDCVAQNGTGG